MKYYRTGKEKAEIFLEVRELVQVDTFKYPERCSTLDGRRTNGKKVELPVSYTHLVRIRQ